MRQIDEHSDLDRRVDEELGLLRVQSPPATLRARTLAGASQRLAEKQPLLNVSETTSAAPPSWGSWYADLALVAALLYAVFAIPRDKDPVPALPAESALAEHLDALDLDPALSRREKERMFPMSGAGPSTASPSSRRFCNDAFDVSVRPFGF